MARTNEFIFSLNAGGVDREALSRIDLEKMRLAGEHPVKNWLPKVIGPMTIRPALESVARLASDLVTRIVPFERDTETSIVLAFQHLTCRMFENGEPVEVQDAASTIANPTFSSALSGAFTTGWKDDSETGAGTDGSASVAGGFLTLIATKYRSASVQQSVAIASGDQATPHTIRIDVAAGPVFVRFGTAQDGQDLMAEARLMTGTHKLTVTPGAAALWIKIRAEDAESQRVVSRVAFEHTLLGGSGPLVLPTNWQADDLPYLAWDQSVDVLFIADGVHQPQRIERRGRASWSIVKYQTRGGPLVLPETNKIRLTPSTYTANGYLTSSLPFFKQSHVGCLFELTHDAQYVSQELNNIWQVTDYVTITGIWQDDPDDDEDVPPDDRDFSITVDTTTGSFVGTIALDRSTDALAEVWAQYKSYTTDASETINDEQSNLVCHYRFRVVSYSSGYATVTIQCKNGARTGLVRVFGYVNSQQVTYEVIKSPGATSSTENWRGPAWADHLGWPRVPRFRDGRLHWFMGDTDYASKVDDFDNYDDGEEGDAAPFVRTVGSGGAAGVRWALDMDKMAIGASSFVASVQASDLGEALTPTNFAVRRGPSIGASFVPPAQIDGSAIMADRSNTRLYEIGVPEASSKISATDVTRLNPSATNVGILAMAVQRQPDTRVYCVLSDGTCAVLTFEKADQVVAFTTIETPGGEIEDVCVIPGETQDRVYFVVKRNETERYLERLAKEVDQQSPATYAGLDAHKVLTGSISSITGGTHLAGQTVHVFADGQHRGTVTLDGSGNASLGATYSRVVYGLSYDAEFLSVKLAYAAQLGSAIGQIKIVHQATPVLSNSVLDGIRLGSDADNTDPMPDIVNGAERTAGQMFASYDEMAFPIPGDWDTDSRLYIKAASHYGPVTVQGIAFDIETRDGAQNRNR